MTEIIIALDGPWPAPIAGYREAGVRWVKIGPQNIAQHWKPIASSMSVFLDLKLADTGDTIDAAVKRFADLGVASISTYTPAATEAALRAVEGTPLQVWQVYRLTDAADWSDVLLPGGAHGIICSVRDAMAFARRDPVTVCPGIRRDVYSALPSEFSHGHKHVATPRKAVEAGVDFIVVGRPIWETADPAAAARVFIEELC
jgi:orotidine-5'-phosphate decarboxylase